MVKLKKQNSRPEIISRLRKRDGDFCQYQYCKLKDSVIDFDLEEGRLMPTIDHHIPQAYMRSIGHSEDEIWATSNLRIFHRMCNADKGDRIPNADGTLPPKKETKFRYRRDKRAQRAEMCTSCNVGRDLGPDEVCASCGSGPMPERFPRWAKMAATECDHEAFWCWACSIGITPRAGATEMIMLGGEGGEE